MAINLDPLATEAPSKHQNLDHMSISDILTGINQEDQTVPNAIAQKIPAIEALIAELVPRMKAGGRLFYIGAGTSGRLGIVDASECPPTYGVPHGWVVGIMAGGDAAIRQAVENAEDDEKQAWQDLRLHNITPQDTVIGIAASGRTPYVVGGLRDARAFGCLTGCIVCTDQSAVAAEAEYPIEVVVGPEFVTGSTRMKAGTAQKLVLNMISTTTMIQLGRVKGNRMVDMQLSNAKLVERGTQMLIKSLQISHSEAQTLLLTHGSVRKAEEAFHQS